ncbi:CdaR family protein [Companilactobacillus nantensis]|uniref:CdaR family protein n=1 Tax=Companilactobacillus nantensis TaxID=305793 RepID=UPI0007093AF0|nr:CdaR family protein [Companilactobacillus nantensis]GEO63322.1 cell surface protein [Companilactobacillus nantensis]
MIKKIINSNYFYAFIALGCALWLFFFVSSPGVGSTRDSNQSNTSTVTKKVTLTVPLQLQADVDKYYITGYPENVKVTIEGPSALVTATKNTQNFNLYLNLKDLSIGQHRVQIKESGLNSELTYNIKPKYVTVNIQRRETKKFAVDVDYNKESLATGYEAGKTEVSPDTVTVTGAASEIEKINKVIVKPILPKGIKSTFDQEVLVQALDKNGKTVNVTLDPQTVHVKIPITIQSKQVSINLKQQGNSNNSNFTLESDVKNIRIFGTQSQIDAINDSVDIPVDVSDVTGNTKKSIDLGNALGSKVAFTDPETISVSISTGTSSSSSTNSNSSTSTNSSNSNSSSTNNNSSSSNNNSTEDNNNSEQ